MCVYIYIYTHYPRPARVPPGGPAVDGREAHRPPLSLGLGLGLGFVFVFVFSYSRILVLVFVVVVVVIVVVVVVVVVVIIIRPRREERLDRLREELPEAGGL